MSCHVAWNRDFIDNNLTKTFRMNDYKKHREDILVDRERSLLPATVPLVEAEKRKRNREKDLIELNQKKTDLIRQMTEITLKMNEVRNGIYRETYNQAGPSSTFTEERKQFIRACPMPDCRGFLSSQWKCGICSTWICPDCHEHKECQKDENHKCNPDNVATAKLLAKDTKPCPKCASSIFKIDGCFAKDTPILLWNGTIKMSQDIIIGDILVGDDGNKRTVLETCTGEDDLYKVDQIKGDSYIVNSKHTLVLTYELHSIVEMTVEAYINAPSDIKSKLQGFKLFKKLNSDINVYSIGRGQYFGWQVDGNNRFLLPDLTCVRNCDFMWCIMCQTSFSWKTGLEIISNNIHNPEYYRYIREKNGGNIPRNLGDIPMTCGNGMPQYWSMQSYITANQHLDRRLYKISSLHRNILHIRDIEVGRNRYDPITNNQDLRVSYLLNEISEEKWKTELQKREKKRELHIARRNVYEMFVTVGTDLMNKLFTALKSKTADFTTILDEFDEIIIYFNDSIKAVAERFGSRSIIQIDDRWLLQDKI
jgi:hypothetical protein